MMAVLKTRLEWYGKKGKNEVVVLDDWFKINITLSTEIKNNLMTISLKNNFARTFTQGRQFNYNNKVVSNKEGDAFFTTYDKFKFYCKYDKNNSGLDLSATSNDLVFSGDLIEVKSKTEDKSVIDLICADKTYILLNSLHWKDYEANGTDSPNGQGWTAPLIIQDMIRHKGLTDDIAVSPIQLIYDKFGNAVPTVEPDTEYYLIDARFSSDTGPNKGFIQDTRNTTIDKFGTIINRTVGTGDSNNNLFPTVPSSTQNYNFPFISIRAVGKPIYEIMNMVSQTAFTNTPDELDTSLTSPVPIITRAMRYYTDEKNRFHWFMPIDNTFNAGTSSASSTDSTDKFGISLNIEMGNTDNFEVKSDDMNYVIFDLINYIYFEAGTDMNGNHIRGFFYDPTTNSPIFKYSRRNWPRIADQMKAKDADQIDEETNILQEKRHITVNKAARGGYDYPTSYVGGVTPFWNPKVTVTTDAQYNTEFRAAVKKEATSRAQAITSRTASQRWKGKITFAFYPFTIGDLIQYTNEAGGIFKEKMRISNINHQIDKSDAKTIITCDVDELEFFKQ